jgi:8-oxo-dGTP pyrophosphatase MutT (NUDIX family)
VVTTTLPLPVANPSTLPVGPAPAPAAPSLPVPAPAPAAPSLPVSAPALSAPPAPTVPAGPVSSKHYRDSDYRLHSSKVAFFDPLTGEVYSHVRRAGGLDLPGGHRDQGEASAAEALLRECLTEELRVPASLASRLRKYAKRAPYVQVVPRRTAVHVVSLWLVPATPAELAGIEQTDDGKREAHSPELRPFATFQAKSPVSATTVRGPALGFELRAPNISLCNSTPGLLTCSFGSAALLNFHVSGLVVCPILPSFANTHSAYSSSAMSYHL